ncbi:MAG: DUF2625 domain-containing protein [Ferruginibacter sp.]
MKSRFIFIGLAFIAFTGLAQNNMRPVEELINAPAPGWGFVKKWIDSAKNKVEVLPVDTIKAREALYKTQVTIHSSMGAIIFMTGGILVDDGWIRILGSGHAKLDRSVPGWNKGKTFKEFGETPRSLLIADDAAGGFFLLNGGALGKDLGKIYYFSPDNLTYEALNITYSEFLLFCFNNDLDKFYETERWKNWRKDVSNLSGNKLFNFTPPLWTKEAENVDKVSRKEIPVEEQYQLNIEFRKKLGFD